MPEEAYEPPSNPPDSHTDSDTADARATARTRSRLIRASAMSQNKHLRPTPSQKAPPKAMACLFGHPGTPKTTERGGWVPVQADMYK